MAFVHGKGTVVYFDTTDFSSYLTNVDMTKSSDVAETTTFGNDNKTYIAGEKDGTISLSGMFDATGDALVQPFVGGTSNHNVIVGIDTLSATKRVSFANGLFTEYGISDPVGDLVAISLSVQADNGFYSGEVLENATITATASGTARDNTTSTANGGGAFLLVSSASGTTPTLDAKITHSADDVTYADLVTFSQATSTTSEVKVVASGTTVNRYLKVEYTVGGTSPSFDVVVGFSRVN
jgi:hypothetical protein